MLVFTPVWRRILDSSAGRGRLLAPTCRPSARARSPESPLLPSCSCLWLADQLCRCVGRSGSATQELAPSSCCRWTRLPDDAAESTLVYQRLVLRPRPSGSDLVRFSVADPVDRAGAAHVGSCAMPRRESHGPWCPPGVTRPTESPGPPPLDAGARSIRAACCVLTAKCTQRPHFPIPPTHNVHAPSCRVFDERRRWPACCWIWRSPMGRATGGSTGSECAGPDGSARTPRGLGPR